MSPEVKFFWYTLLGVLVAIIICNLVGVSSWVYAIGGAAATHVAWYYTGLWKQEFR